MEDTQKHSQSLWNVLKGGFKQYRDFKGDCTWREYLKWNLFWLAVHFMMLCLFILLLFLCWSLEPEDMMNAEEEVIRSWKLVGYACMATLHGWVLMALVTFLPTVSMAWRKGMQACCITFLLYYYIVYPLLMILCSIFLGNPYKEFLLKYLM